MLYSSCTNCLGRMLHSGIGYVHEDAFAVPGLVHLAQQFGAMSCHHGSGYIRISLSGPDMTHGSCFGVMQWPTSVYSPTNFWNLESTAWHVVPAFNVQNLRVARMVFH